MQFKNKILGFLQAFFLLGFSSDILHTEVVITEFFLHTADNSNVPQYIELFNNSDTAVNLESWWIASYKGDGTSTLDYPACNPLPHSCFPTFNTSATAFCDVHTTSIEPFGYFLISTRVMSNNTFFNSLLPDINASNLILPFDGKGSIILFDNNDTGIDTVAYDIAQGWPTGQANKGHSIRLHVAPNSSANDSANNWSSSPVTDISNYLFSDILNIKNFGSPREENSFRLNLALQDSTFTIKGDYNNYHGVNNFNDLINFSWDGTFYNESGQNYRILINKINSIQPDVHGFDASLTTYDSSIVTSNNTQTSTYSYIWENNGISMVVVDDTLNTNENFKSITPQNLSIGQLEEATYTWTVQLDKGNDIVYSDIDTFRLDASDYGIYGCIDNGSCTINSSGFPTCASSANNDTLISSHTVGCVPGLPINEGGCFSALNYHSGANINSNACHYVSLSMPSYTIGNPSSITPVPIYMHNNSPFVTDLTFVDSIYYVLKVTDQSIAYINDTTVPNSFDNFVTPTIISNNPDSIIVQIGLDTGIGVNTMGIINYMNFYLPHAIASESTGLSFLSANVKGGTPSNNILNFIEVPIKNGDIVNTLGNYEISGKVIYYWSDPDPSNQVNNYEIPNIEINLNRFNGASQEIVYKDTTTEGGYYEFQLDTGGSYLLSLSKGSSECSDIANYIDHRDITAIVDHVKEKKILDSLHRIAADLSLDNSITGFDASLLAQYKVDLIENFNELNTHWIIKPIDTSNLSPLPLYAELIEKKGQYDIKYEPLLFDDKNRDYYAYLLGDVASNYYGDYCGGQLSRYDKNIDYKAVFTDYQSILKVLIIVSEPIYLEGMNLEIGYKDEVFTPISYTFDPSYLLYNQYESVSNLNSNEGTIKSIMWAKDNPILVSGILAEVSFKWEDVSNGGQIWLEDLLINDMSEGIGLTLTGDAGQVIANGLDIKNKFYSESINLDQNYPNPFNPKTSIYWSMSQQGKVAIEIYNIKGQLINTLFDDYKDEGAHEIIWDASGYASGVYFYRLTINDTILQRKMILLR